MIIYNTNEEIKTFNLICQPIDHLRKENEMIKEFKRFFYEEILSLLFLVFAAETLIGIGVYWPF